MARNVALVLTLMMVCLALAHTSWVLGIGAFVVFCSGAMILSR